MLDITDACSAIKMYKSVAVCLSVQRHVCLHVGYCRCASFLGLPDSIQKPHNPYTSKFGLFVYRFGAGVDDICSLITGAVWDRKEKLLDIYIR